jgi:flagellar basal-body rod modification protein FlgD
MRGVDSNGVEVTDGSQNLSQEDFFALLTEQLAYQDPTKPADNDQMIAQMTNFTMAEGISNMSKEFASFSQSMTSGQTLQASSLIGRNILIPSGNVSVTDGNTTTGVIAAPQSAQNVALRIEDANGQLIRTIQLGNKEAGTFNFEWDGKDSDGNPVEDGNYVIKAQGRIGNDNTALTVATHTRVNSVNVGASGQGITVNTSLGPVAFSDVIEVSEVSG